MMPKKRCGLGFNCGAMMQQPGLEAKDCLNYKTCGSASELTPEEEVELIRVRQIESQRSQEEWERVQERFRVSRQQAALLMLRERACPQNLESLGITDLLSVLEQQLDQVGFQVREIEQAGYVAPEGVEAHRYNVKRYKVYWYNKLTAPEAMFAPVEREDLVRVIHLSHDDDPRNLEARAGVERRNQLLQIKTQLSLAQAALNEAVRLAAVQ